MAVQHPPRQHPPTQEGAGILVLSALDDSDAEEWTGLSPCSPAFPRGSGHTSCTSLEKTSPSASASAPKYAASEGNTNAGMAGAGCRRCVVRVVSPLADVGCFSATWLDLWSESAIAAVGRKS